MKNNPEADFFFYQRKLKCNIDIDNLKQTNKQTRQMKKGKITLKCLNEWKFNVFFPSNFII